MDLDYLITTIFAGVAAIPISLFIYFYGTRPIPGKPLRWYNRRPSTRWRITKEGQILMGLVASWLAILIFAVVNRTFGEWPGRNIVSFILFATWAFLFWAFFLQLRRTQKETSENPDDPRTFEDTNPNRPRNRRRQN